MSITVGVLGASGTTGGELVRYLVGHPEVELAWASSQRYEDHRVAAVHPHLDGVTELAFSPSDAVPELDVLFTAAPHGTVGERMEELLARAGLVIDLSSDLRLRDAVRYEATYGREHPAPGLAAEAAYGLPELHRDRIAKVRLVAGPGCLAASAILALAPLARAELIADGPVVLDGKIGSTAAGTGGGAWSAHAVRSGTVRPYAPAGHRHEAEVRQEVFAGAERPLWFSAHATDMTRGILQTAHVPVPAGTHQRELHRTLLTAYADEPFVSVLPGRPRPGQMPEPRFVAGTNRAQVAAMKRPDTDAAVVVCAIDNLGKGAAGSAVQCMNIRKGLAETAGLDAIAAYP